MSWSERERQIYGLFVPDVSPSLQGPTMAHRAKKAVMVS
jgi:hypothetical protein